MKRAIVIGASSGIGRALAELLVEKDFMVGVTGRRRELLEELRARLAELTESLDAAVAREAA